jgi:tetratricopeptide (TPR) repeat protein
MTSDLAALVRKRLLRPDQPELSGEDAYRFTHVLLREEAYESLPYERRSALHEELADWLETRRAELAAADELIGHHLAEAHRHLAAVGGGERVEGLGHRAGDLLVEAALRAEARDDAPSALRLFERGLELLPLDAPVRTRALFVLATTQEGAYDYEIATATLGQAVAAADRLGNGVLATLAQLELAGIELQTRPSVDATARWVELVEDGVEEATRVGDDWALAIAWDHVCQVNNMRNHYSEGVAAAERARVHSRRAGNARAERVATGRLGGSLDQGPTPVLEAIRRCEQILAERGEAIGFSMVGQLAVLVAMRGDHERAYELLDRMHEIAREHGIPQLKDIRALWIYARIATDEGDWHTAIETHRLSLEDQLRLGERAFASTTLAWLAECLAHIGELDEAEKLASDATEFAGNTDDPATDGLVASARALIASKRGAHHQALQHAEQALAILNTTDHLNGQAQLHLDYADVHARNGDIPRAEESAQYALELYRGKQSIVGEARAQAIIDGLRRPTTA